jgi:hypothetical protein
MEHDIHLYITKNTAKGKWKSVDLYLGNAFSLTLENTLEGWKSLEHEESIKFLNVATCKSLLDEEDKLLEIEIMFQALGKTYDLKIYPEEWTVKSRTLHFLGINRMGNNIEMIFQEKE